MLPNIHILGIQGSGKGTQSALLVERYQLNYASSGNLFRERAEIDDELGRSIKEELKTGRLFANELLVATIADYLDSHPIINGFLGDGVIRNLAQYELLKEPWSRHNLDEPYLIHLELSEQTALKRIEQRKLEQSDPNKYQHHLTYSGKLLRRTDDNPAAIAERFALFHQMTTPVITFFEQRNRCFHLNADQSVEAIQAGIVQFIEQAYPELVSHVTN